MAQWQTVLSNTPLSLERALLTVDRALLILDMDTGMRVNTEEVGTLL